MTFRRIISPLASVSLFFLLLLSGYTLQILFTSAKEGEKGEARYFEQWFNERKNKDGIIPSWLHAKWAAWDKSQVLARNSDNIIDTVIELGPLYIGGRTRALWVDPRNDNVILAAAITGGLWRSTNGGTTWAAVNDHMASLITSSITSSPFNPDIIYVGTGEGRPASNVNVEGNGIYKSTDGGKTFFSLTSTVNKSGFETIWEVKHSLTDSNTLFAGTHSAGLWRSTNAGLTWEQVFKTGTSPINHILTLNNNRLLISNFAGSIYASDSGGKGGTFYATNPSVMPTGGTYGRIQLANCKKFPNVVYAVYEGYEFDANPVACYKSSNGGRTWTAKAAPTAAGRGQQAYNLLLGVNPVDSNQLVVGCVYLVQSSNGGTSWSSKKYGHSDQHSFAGFSTLTTDFLVGSDGGVWRHKWAGNNNPVSLNVGYKVTQFYAGGFGPAGLVSIAGAQDNGTHVATDILTSKQVYSADGGYAFIGQQDGSVAYFSTQNDGIRRFDNFNPAVVPTFSVGIADARFANDGVSFINPYYMCPGDQSQLYYRTNKYIYRSLDWGENWEIISKLRPAMKAIAASKESNPVLYFGGSAAQLYRYDKASTATVGTEVSLKSAFPITKVGSDFISSIVVHPLDKNIVFVTFSTISSQPRVWRLTGLDGSNPASTAISGNLPPSLPVNSIAVDPAFPDKNLFVGTDFGLYYSTDSGKTWEKEYRIPNAPVQEVKMRDDRNLFVYTYGRGMWNIQLIPASGVKNISAKSNVVITPNPTADFIQFEIKALSNYGTYSIFNCAGMLVGEGKLSNGVNKISVINLPNGHYFLRTKVDNNSAVAKLVITH